LGVIADFELILREVDIDECIDCDEKVDFLNLSLKFEEDVVFLEDEVVDMFEMREIEPKCDDVYFLTKDFMYFMVIYFSCLPYNLHSSTVIPLESSYYTE